MDLDCLLSQVTQSQKEKHLHVLLHIRILVYNVHRHICKQMYMGTYCDISKREQKGIIFGDEEGENAGKRHMSHQRGYKVHCFHIFSNFNCHGFFFPFCGE